MSRRCKMCKATLTRPERIRNRASNIVKTSFDHQATQGWPATAENSTQKDSLSDEKQHVRTLNEKTWDLK